MTTRERAENLLDRLEAEGMTAHGIELLLAAAFKEFRQRQRVSGRRSRTLTAPEVRRRNELHQGQPVISGEPRIILPDYANSALVVPDYVAREREAARAIEHGLLRRGWKRGRCHYCRTRRVPTIRLPNRLRSCYSCYPGELKP